MTDAALLEADLAGRDFQSVVTDLLLNSRSDDPLTGLGGRRPPAVVDYR